jgi:hypothetical protein
MDRKTHRKPIDGTLFRYQVTFTSDPVAEGTHHYKLVQHQMLLDLLETPGMLECGLEPFETLRMYHDGERWVVEMEATGF